MKNVIFIALILVGGAGWILYAREHRTVNDYAQREAMRASITAAATNASPATFDRVDGDTIHFSTQVQATTAQGTYTNYVPQVGKLTADGRVYRTNSDGVRIDTLQGLASGTPMYIELASDPENPSQYLISAIYIVE